MITYRDAGPADADALAAIGRETFRVTFEHFYRPADLAAFFADHHTTEEAAYALADGGTATRFVEEHGAVAGFAQVTPSSLPHARPGRRTFELKRLYLLPSLHGRGIADALIAWAIERARAGGWEDLALSVFSQNPRAQAFYARHGFKVVGPATFKVGEQIDDEFIMTRAVA